MTEENSSATGHRLLLVEKTEVNCLTCHEQVSVILHPFGGGRIAACPICKQLAYNGK